MDTHYRTKSGFSGHLENSNDFQMFLQGVVVVVENMFPSQPLRRYLMSLTPLNRYR